MPHLQPCAHPHCHTLLPHGTRRCQTHQLQPRGHAHRQARTRTLTNATHCHTCGQTPTATNPLTLGHRIARANGGTLAPTNTMAQCQRCNLKQGTQTVFA